MHNPHVLIIGAGAGGLFCAFNAAQRGLRVLVLDHANKAGKKILMSGGGRCNFTNLYATPDDYLCSNPHFVKSALARYTPWDFLALADKHGVAHEEKNPGQLFCRDGARGIQQLLLDECAAAAVQIRLNTTISCIRALPGGGFAVQGTAGQSWQCNALVIATGGLSIPSMGASGFGYQVAAQFGHSLRPTRAGLVPFTISEPRLKQLCTELSGTALHGVSVRCGEQVFTDDLLLTHRGLSGPVMLQISSYWQPGQALRLDLLPGHDFSWWQDQQARRGNSELKTLLGECLTRKLAQALLAYFGWDNKPLKQYSPAELNSIASLLSHWEITPAGTEGYRTAEVTIGGVNTDEVSSQSMESRLQPGLYFIGEVLDVSGQLGGFNFQWAWASAHAAASAILVAADSARTD